MSDTPPFPSPTKRWHSKAQPSTLPSRPELSCKGKSIIVTGGGNTGIGGCTARYFAEAGASRICLLGRRESHLLENKALIEQQFPGVEVVTISADVTTGQVEDAFAKFAAGGRIDVVVHTAAVVGPREPLTEVDAKEYLEPIQANIAGAYYVAKAFVRHAAPDGVAIAVNSWAAHLSLDTNWSSYCVAKMAVYRLWDTVAQANPGLSVFHTQPGVILTEMNLRVGGAESFKEAKVDDVSLPAAFNLWLASPEARFLNRKFLWCNWDVDELKAQTQEIEAGTKLSIGIMGWPF